MELITLCDVRTLLEDEDWVNITCGIGFSDYKEKISAGDVAVILGPCAAYGSVGINGCNKAAVRAILPAIQRLLVFTDDSRVHEGYEHLCRFAGGNAVDLDRFRFWTLNYPYPEAERKDWNTKAAVRATVDAALSVDPEDIAHHIAVASSWAAEAYGRCGSGPHTEERERQHREITAMFPPMSKLHDRKND